MLSSKIDPPDEEDYIPPTPEQIRNRVTARLLALQPEELADLLVSNYGGHKPKECAYWECFMRSLIHGIITKDDLENGAVLREWVMERLTKEAEDE